MLEALPASAPPVRVGGGVVGRVGADLWSRQIAACGSKKTAALHSASKSGELAFNGNTSSAGDTKHKFNRTHDKYTFPMGIHDGNKES